MREKIYNIIEPGSRVNRYADYYDIFMIFVILCSFIPLLVKEETPVIRVIDLAAAAIFIIDYLLRWGTADFKYGKKTPGAFARYPFSLMAIVDLLSILPALALLHPAFKLCRFVRLIRALRALRLLRIFRYSRNIRIIVNVFREQKSAFLMVLILTAGYVFISAAIMFQVEPDTFDNFFDAIYWACILLTTVGYGDVVAVSTVGKVITIISSVMGIAVIALPAGIITAGYMEELDKVKKERGNRKKE